MLNCNNTTIYVGMVPDGETTKIPADVVNLTGLLDGFGTTQISGLTRPKAEINRSALAGANASRISGAQITERNIVMDIVPQGDGEEMRQALYDILPFDTMLRFYVATKQRCVYIDGYAEELEGDEPNGDEFSVQVSIICPFPWFQSVKLHTQEILAQRTSTFIARNDGDIPAGFMLKNSDHFNDYSIIGLKVDVGGNAFQANANSEDPLENRMRSPIELVTTRGSRKFMAQSDVPAFALIAKDSVWPQLPAGNNDVTVTTSFTWEIAEEDFDKPFFHFRWRDTYSGV